MNAISTLNMVKQNFQFAKKKNHRFLRIICRPLKYFLYFAIIQVLWGNFSNYQSSIETQFSQLADGIIDVASADSDYIRRCYITGDKQFKASEIYPIQTNITNVLNNYLKIFHKLNGLISYSSYLKLHEFSYCYSSKILDHIQDGCDLYSLKVRDMFGKKIY